MDFSKSLKPEPTAMDVIFSCHICQDSISDIYSKSPDNSGFRDGRPDTRDTRVTSLWLTSCMHLTCGKHLEGGGAPFHPEGEHAQAACPVCVKEKKDERPKKLYAIRGWKKGAYDRDIPEELFVTPPMKLDGQGIEMESLQFQYLSLVRYGTAMFANYRTAEQARLKAERHVKELEEEKRATLSENKELKDRVAEMQKGQTEVTKWRKRMPQITHYLSICPELIAEIDQLRSQLYQLGYAVPRRDYSMELKAGPKERVENRAEDSLKQNEAQGRSSNSSGRKRKHSEYIEGIEAPGYAQPQLQNKEHVRQSLMPPPAIPSGHMLGAENSRPLTRPHALPHEAQVQRHSAAENTPIQVYEDGVWLDDARRSGRAATLSTSSFRCDPDSSQLYMMSGAIPPSPSTIRRQRSGDYIRLQGERQPGLRFTDENAYHVYDRRSSEVIHPKDTRQKGGYRIHLSPPLRSGVNRQPLFRPVARTSNVMHDAIKQAYPTNSPYQHGTPRRIVHDPVTPAPARFRAPLSARKTDSVASPFFKSGMISGKRQSGLTAGMAGLSAHARVGSTTSNSVRDLRRDLPAQNWDEPRSLNGLSFINEPRDDSNRPVFRERDSYTRRCPPISPFLSNATRNADRGLFERQIHSSSVFGSAAPSQLMSSATPSRHFKMSPSTPSFIQGPYRPWSSARAFTKDDALNMVNNAKSSALHRGQPPTYSSTSREFIGRTVPESNGLLSASGRRSVRR